MLTHITLTTYVREVLYDDHLHVKLLKKREVKNSLIIIIIFISPVPGPYQEPDTYFVDQFSHRFINIF